MSNSQAQTPPPEPSRKRVRFGEVTYIPIPPRRRRVAFDWWTPPTDLLGNVTDCSHGQVHETGHEEMTLRGPSPPLGASSQLPCASPPLDAALQSDSPPHTLSWSSSLPAQADDNGDGFFHVHVPTPRLGPDDRTPETGARDLSAERDDPSAARRRLTPAEILEGSAEAHEKLGHPSSPIVERRLDASDFDLVRAPSAESARSPLPAGGTVVGPRLVATSGGVADGAEADAVVRCRFCGLAMEPGEVEEADDASVKTNREAEGGRSSVPRLAPHWICVDGLACHIGCALWCPEVYYDVAEGALRHVGDAHSRAQSVVCDHCHCRGAAVPCASEGCQRHYHLPCAVVLNAELHNAEYMLWCPLHRSAHTD